MANRQYKDSVFRMFFNNRKELAKLYQAIRPDKTIRPEDITINTLEDVAYTDESEPPNMMAGAIIGPRADFSICS